MEDWTWWLVAAGVLGISLVIATVPELAMFAVGALAASLTGWLGGPMLLQVAVFAIVSVVGVAAVRPIARRHRQTPGIPSGVDALKGASATVVEQVDNEGGRIKLAGEVWSAQALEPDRIFEVGEKVDVAEIKGATAIVM